VFNPVTLVVKLFGDTMVTPAVEELPPGEGVKLSKDHVGLPEKFVERVPVSVTELAQTVLLPPAFTEQFCAKFICVTDIIDINKKLRQIAFMESKL